MHEYVHAIVYIIYVVQYHFAIHCIDGYIQRYIVTCNIQGCMYVYVCRVRTHTQCSSPILPLSIVYWPETATAF